MERVLMIMMMLSILGSGKNLEKLMSSQMAKEEITNTTKEFLEATGDVYSDYDIEISGNDLIYSYYFVDDFDDEKLGYIKEAFEAEDSWSETIESIKDEIELNSKIRPEKVTFAYYSADGNEIYKITQYKQSIIK